MQLSLFFNIIVLLQHIPRTYFAKLNRMHLSCLCEITKWLEATWQFNFKKTNQKDHERSPVTQTLLPSQTLASKTIQTFPRHIGSSLGREIPETLRQCPLPDADGFLDRTSTWPSKTQRSTESGPLLVKNQGKPYQIDDFDTIWIHLHLSLAYTISHGLSSLNHFHHILPEIVLAQHHQAQLGTKSKAWHQLPFTSRSAKGSIRLLMVASLIGSAVPPQFYTVFTLLSSPSQHPISSELCFCTAFNRMEQVTSRLLPDILNSCHVNESITLPNLQHLQPNFLYLCNSCW